MDVTTILFGWILPYLVGLVFIIGLGARVLNLAHTPLPFPLTLFPAPIDNFGAVGDVAKEVFFLRSLWRANPSLWVMAWIFHATLALVLAGHFFGILFLGHQFTIFGLTPAASEGWSIFLGTWAGVILLVALFLLTLRRLVQPELRFISSAGDYLVLILLLGVILSGCYMRFFHGVAYGAVRTYLAGLLTLHPVAPPANPVFLLHFTLVELLLLYFPFSKLVHSCGVFLGRWMITRPYTRQVIWK